MPANLNTRKFFKCSIPAKEYIACAASSFAVRSNTCAAPDSVAPDGVAPDGAAPDGAPHISSAVIFSSSSALKTPSLLVSKRFIYAHNALSGNNVANDCAEVSADPCTSSVSSTERQSFVSPPKR